MNEITNSDELKYELDKLIQENELSAEELASYVARSIPLDMMQRFFNSVKAQIVEDAQ